MARFVAAGLVAISIASVPIGCGSSSGNAQSDGGANGHAGSGGAGTSGAPSGGSGANSSGAGGADSDQAGAGERNGESGAGSEEGGMGGMAGNSGASAGSGGTAGATAGSGGTSGTAGSSAGNGASGGGGSVCPSTAPTVGSSCSPNGRDCSFGTSAFPECRTRLTCSGGKWAIGINPGTCVNTAPSVCPASTPPASTACNAGDVGARCAYDPGTLCSCVNEVCGGTGCTTLPSPQWVCGKVTTGCPAQAPNSGSACDGSHPRCQYEYCGLTATCQSGFWTWMFGCA